MPNIVVTMGMPVRLRPFTPLMIMLMMLVMDMPVVVPHRLVRMLDNDRVARRQA
jgi:hypothetical protein